MLLPERHHRRGRLGQPRQVDELVTVTERIGATRTLGKRGRVVNGPVAGIPAALEQLAKTGDRSCKTRFRVGVWVKGGRSEDRELGSALRQKAVVEDVD